MRREELLCTAYSVPKLLHYTIVLRLKVVVLAYRFLSRLDVWSNDTARKSDSIKRPRTSSFAFEISMMFRKYR
jgi:hypothetical protein